MSEDTQGEVGGLGLGWSEYFQPPRPAEVTTNFPVLGTEEPWQVSHRFWMRDPWRRLDFGPEMG